MRAVVQRVVSGRVVVVEDGGQGREVGRIGVGLVVLLGVEQRDAEADAAWMAGKIVGLRVFEDEALKMNRGLTEVAAGGVEAGVLVVPNFTVAGSAAKGRRPDFTNAMKPPGAEALFERVVGLIRREAGSVTVLTGVFGASMLVELVNDGPVTVVLESPGS